MEYLWIYTSIAGALLGAACLAYIRDTRIGLWGYSKFDQILDWLRDRYGWTWFDQDPEAWKKVNPKIAAKIQELENRINEMSRISGDNRNISSRKNSAGSIQRKD
jgi:hypothetical protein|tara:strand:- start:417 stop:731 length:315 start_codon:yes stop_codon:yes gene_type:complete